MRVLWETEAAMVAEFTAWAQHKGWTVYAEWAEWDLVLVRPEDGFQIGVEAKLSLNAKVLCQVLAHRRDRAGEGPDCHAVLVPALKSVNGLEIIAAELGVTVIQGGSRNRYDYTPGWSGAVFRPALPELKDRPSAFRAEEWPQRCPDRRLCLPDYVPDVTGGHSAPVKLTQWKIAALKAAAIIETRGFITRTDFKGLNLSPSRWTQFWLKSDGQGGWVPDAMPDFKAQHPVNYEQIKADMPKWLTWQVPARQPALIQPELIAGATA